MRAKRILAFIPVLLWGGVALQTASAKTSCDGPLMGRVQAAYQAIGSFSGDFLQHDRSMSGKNEQASGTVDYLKPGQMRWNYAAPHEQLLVTNGKIVWLFDPLLDNVTIHPLEKLTRGTPLAFLLGAGSLSRDFACRPLSGSPPDDGLIYLELKPKSAIPGLDFIRLGLNRKNMRIAALHMVDTLGNLRIVRLNNLKIGVQFPREHFTFKISKDMEVIKP